MEAELFFKDNLIVNGYSKGRSSVLFELRSLTDGTKYYTFISDFNDIVISCTINMGIIMGHEWTFTKKGGNYGMKLYQWKSLYVIFTIISDGIKFWGSHWLWEMLK